MKTIKKLLKKITTFCVMALVATTLVSCGGGGSAEVRVIRNYLEAVKARDYQKAASFWNVNRLEIDRQAERIERFAERGGVLPGCIIRFDGSGGLRDFEVDRNVSREEFDGETASIVRVTWAWYEGNPANFKFALQRIDGEWKIIDMGWSR